MAELKNHEEPSFPSKRKPDPTDPDLPHKPPKIPSLDPQQPIPNSTNNHVSEPPTTANCSSDVVPKEDGHDYDNELENDDEEFLGDDEDEDEDDDGDDEEEEEVDPKGKGVLRDDKGKGKLMEEEDEDDDDSDDDDDSGDDGSVSGDDSDFSDDPLAEVDLNNILPSRTRRRAAHSGVRIAGDSDA